MTTKKNLILGLLFSVFLFGGCGQQTPTLPEGTIVFEEFSDIQCPFCKNLHPVIEKLKTDFPNVHFQYKYFPLEQIHDRAFPAAIAAECVKKFAPEKFDSYLSSLYAAANLEDGTLTTLAKNVGVAEESFSFCLKNEDTIREVRASMKEGVKRGVNGTPTLFINGVQVPQTAQDLSYEGLYGKLKATSEKK